MKLEIECENYVFEFDPIDDKTCRGVRKNKITAEVKELGTFVFSSYDFFRSRFSWLILSARLDEAIVRIRFDERGLVEAVDEYEAMEYNPIRTPIMHHTEFPRQNGDRILDNYIAQRGYSWVGRAPPRQLYNSEEGTVVRRGLNRLIREE